MKRDRGDRTVVDGTPNLRLQRHGQAVTAKVTAVDRNTRVRVNGRSPWVIRAQWLDPATNTVHTFESENIWFDPGPHTQGETVQVLIDRDDPKRHVMDTSFLPKHAG
ncbi:MAG: hypothetical protein ABII00_10600 [Elusimicrobiota bacterium]